MLGNGDLGAAVFGYPDNYTLALGKADLWDRRDPGRGFLPEGTFADVRRCFEQQDEEEYDRLSATLPTCRLPTLMPAGVLRLRVAEAAINSSCSQRLSLFTGISTTSFLPTGQYVQTQRSRGESTQIRTLVSLPHDVLALRLIPGAYPLGPVGMEYSRSPTPEVPAPDIQPDGPVALLRYRLPAGDSYVVALSVDGAEIEWQTAGHRLVGDGEVPAAGEELVVYATLVSETDTADPLDLARQRLERAAAAGIGAVEAGHRKWWSSFWERTHAFIDDDGAERGFYRGTYLCGSCLRPGKQSPGLQGAWVKENHPAWRADFHGNINMQALYWGCFTGNRPDLVEPLLAYYLSILPRCRRHTREYFQMDGVYLPHACDIFGNPLGNTSVLNLLTSMTPSCWLASMFWDHFAYTQDRRFLEEIAYPLLREVTHFTEDYVSIDAQDKVTIAPSIQWETGSKLEGWGVNSQYDLAALRRLWQVTLQAAEILGTDSEERGRWQRRLAGMPDFPQDGGSGGWKAFADKPPIHASGHGPWLTCPVFPFEQVSLYHGPRSWYRQALASHRDEEAHGSPLPAWCGGYGVGIAARLGLRELALELARMEAGPTFSLGSWESPIIQVDHAPGMSRALGDLLLLTLGGVIHLFPGVPGPVSAWFHSLRAEGAFLVTAEKRGREVAYALLHSLSGSRLRLASPFGNGEPVPLRLRCLVDGGTVVAGEYRRISDEEAAEVELAADSSRTWVVETDTAPGMTYVLERQDQPLEAIERVQI